MAIEDQAQLDFEKALVDHKTHSEMQRLNLQAGFTYVTEGTKAAFLLNGAAAIALLTFMGSQQRTPGWAPLVLTEALSKFAIGAFFAVLTLGIAYLSQSFFAAMNFQRKNRSTPAECLRYFGVLTFFASVGFFLWGLVRAASEFNPNFRLF